MNDNERLRHQEQDERRDSKLSSD